MANAGLTLEDELARLFRRAAGPAHRLALTLTADREVAADIVQEAFLRILRRREALEQVEALDGYLLRTVRNLALDHLRRAQARPEALELAAESLLEAAPGAAGTVDPERVALALLRLPLEQREVVLLRVWEGLSFAEVAARAEVPLGTVHSRYRAALGRLRALLEAGHGGR